MNISSDSLPISKELADDIDKLNKEYHQLFINTEEEFRYKGFETKEAEIRFEQEKINLLKRLREELAGLYEI